MGRLLEIGQTVDGKYRIDRLIGQGGMGRVYEATNLLIDRKVALKTLIELDDPDTRAAERLQREARIAGSIGHDNICDVMDLGKLETGAPYVVMPLLEGLSLRQLLDREGLLPVDRAVDIMTQVLSGLAAAHDRHIVHRDLKPENIFITRIGDRANFVKILDFGISKYLDARRDSAITHTGAVPGTTYYLSPEQAEGNKNTDRRADIYAAGAVLYEMLTGRRPFEGESHNQVLVKIITKSFPPPRTVNDAVPIYLEQLIQKALSRDPAMRFATAAEMEQALRKKEASPVTPPPSLTTAEDITAVTSETSWDDSGRFEMHRSRFRVTLLLALGVVFVAAVSVWGLMVTGSAPLSTESNTGSLENASARRPRRADTALAPDSQGVLGAADAKITLDSGSKRVISDETPPGRSSVESSAAGLEQPQDNSESPRRQRRENRLKSKTKRARHTVTGRHDTIFSVDYGE